MEVASPSDSARAVNDKARMWLSYGAQLVWALHPNTRSVDMHPQDGVVTTLAVGDTLDGGYVLPGFERSLADIFDAEYSRSYIRRILP